VTRKRPQTTVPAGADSSTLTRRTDCGRGPRRRGRRTTKGSSASEPASRQIHAHRQSGRVICLPHMAAKRPEAPWHAHRLWHHVETYTMDIDTVRLWRGGGRCESGVISRRRRGAVCLGLAAVRGISAHKSPGIRSSHRKPDEQWSGVHERVPANDQDLRARKPGVVTSSAPKWLPEPSKEDRGFREAEVAAGLFEGAGRDDVTNRRRPHRAAPYARTLPPRTVAL
jgi:hypothetical protein